MSQLRFTKGMLYVRRYRRGDQADSFITAMQMAANELINSKRGKPHYYVAVRRGFPHEVIEIARSKQDLKARFIGRPWRDTQRWFRMAK